MAVLVASPWGRGLLLTVEVDLVVGGKGQMEVGGGGGTAVRVGYR